MIFHSILGGFQRNHSPNRVLLSGVDQAECRMSELKRSHRNQHTPEIDPLRGSLIRGCITLSMTYELKSALRSDLGRIFRLLRRLNSHFE